jgi:hypothetical protein
MMCVLILDVQAQQLDVQAHVESGPESRGLNAGAWTSMTQKYNTCPHWGSDLPKSIETADN